MRENNCSLNQDGYLNHSNKEGKNIASEKLK